MELEQIEAYLNSTEWQERLTAVKALSDYEADVAVPLLLQKIHDSEFLIRSIVAMGLGKKQTADSFSALLEMMRFDRDSNVRAEASNSLSLYGKVSSSHLVQAFVQDDNWLVRRSILAALAELDTPDDLYDVCVCGLEDEDLTVRETSIEALGLLTGTEKQELVLTRLLTLVNDSQWRIRLKVARSLRRFEDERAKDSLARLTQDSDHRVVGAALEDLLPPA